MHHAFPPLSPPGNNQLPVRPRGALLQALSQGAHVAVGSTSSPLSALSTTPGSYCAGRITSLVAAMDASSAQWRGAQQDQLRHYNVKNTFIEVDEPPPSPMTSPDRFAMTCQARFSDPAFFPQSPIGLALGGIASSSSPLSRSSAGISPKTAKSHRDSRPDGDASKVPRGFCPSGATTSSGSAMHGDIGPDGQLKCQPCAWFFKETGCLNGAQCRYCHLCPHGELKNRKKQKIQKLRAQEADEAALAAAQAQNSASPSSMEAAVAAEMASPSGRIMLSAALEPLEPGA
mmetsp:Transcript_90516/g.255176  ORF Transcript_90516/g.255176 Transcript_90516/m.255176 type:complete len:288 (+) Transcript_90516:3-866(+)